MLVLNPGTSASAAYFAPLAKTIVVAAPRLAGVGGRAAREPARGPVDARRGQGRAGHGAAGVRLLPRLAHGPAITTHFQLDPGRRGRLTPSEWGMNTEIEDLRRVVLRAQEARRQGRRRRPLARRHDHHRLRDLGLQRQGGRRRARRPRLHRRRQRPDAGHAPTRRTQSLAELQRGLAVADRSAASPRRSPACSTRPARSACSLDPNAPSVRPGLPAAAGEPQAARAGDQRRPVRLRAGHRDLAALAGRGAGAPRPPRDVSGDPRGWDDAGELTPLRPLRGRCSRGWGLQGPRRHGLVPPAAPDDRRRRGRRRQRQPGPEGARRARHARRRPAEEPADLRLRRGARRPRACSTPTKRAGQAVGDPAPAT